MNERQKNIRLHAEKLFAQNGFSATSVRDIAKAAGVNVSMISYYFGSKNQLLNHIFDVRMSEGLDFANRILDKNTLDAGQKLLEILNLYVDQVYGLKDFYRVMQTEQIVNTNPEIQELLRKSRLNFLNILEALLKEGKKNGLFENEIPATLLHASLTGTLFCAQLNRSIYQEYSDEKIINDENYWIHLKKYLLEMTRKLIGYESK